MVGETRTATSAFDRPVFIVSSPRSGSSLLFETVALAPGAYTIGGESHALIETIPGLHPRDRGWSSNRLEAEDASPPIVAELIRRFRHDLRDGAGRPATGHAQMIEKTPKNSLRIPFLCAAFPNACFVFLYRDARQTLSSMMEAWRTGRFCTYPRLPDWPGLPWSLLLVPGWRALRGRPLEEIIAMQWSITMTTLVSDLAALPPERVTALSYDAFIADPQRTVAGLTAVLGLGWNRQLGATLPLSPTVVSRPAVDKWMRDGDAIRAVAPLFEDADRRARDFLGHHAIG